MQPLTSYFQQVFFSNTELKYFKFILFIYCFDLPDFSPKKLIKIFLFMKRSFILFILHYF